MWINFQKIEIIISARTANSLSWTVASLVLVTATSVVKPDKVVCVGSTKVPLVDMNPPSSPSSFDSSSRKVIGTSNSANNIVTHKNKVPHDNNPSRSQWCKLLFGFDKLHSLFFSLVRCHCCFETSQYIRREPWDAGKQKLETRFVWTNLHPGLKVLHSEAVCSI